MKATTLKRFVAKFPDEASLLHCLRQIGEWDQDYASGLAAILAAPGFSLESHFCENPTEGPYLAEFHQDGDMVSFALGDCHDGTCGQGGRYHFHLPSYQIDTEQSGQDRWIH